MSFSNSLSLPWLPSSHYRIGKGGNATYIHISLQCLLHDVHSQTQHEMELSQKALPRAFINPGRSEKGENLTKLSPRAGDAHREPLVSLYSARTAPSTRRP